MKVTGKTLAKPSFYHYWVHRYGENINLTDQEQVLPPGAYKLCWDFRGGSGSKLEFNLENPNGDVLVHVSDKIPPGLINGGGEREINIA